MNFARICTARRAALVAALALVGFAGVLGLSQQTASAQTAVDPDFWKGTAERRNTVYRFVYGQSPQSIPATYDPVREAEEILRQHQRNLPPSDPKSRSVWRQIRGITVKSALSSATRALGTIGLAAGTFELGWRIGTGINAKFLKIGVPANGPIPASYYQPQITFRSAGERSSLWRKVPMPVDGWVWSIVSSAYSHQRSSEFRPRVDNGECQVQAFTPPPGFLQASAPAEQYACAYYPTLTDVTDLLIAYVPELAVDVTAPIEPYTNQPYDRSTDAPPAPAQSSVEQAIDTELDKPENELLRDWLNYQLGSPGAEDPTGNGPRNPVVLPVPAEDETVTEYAERLDELGLRPSVLELDEVDPTREPSEVVSVEPEPGTQVETDREIKVTVNRTRDCEKPLFHYTSLSGAAGILTQSAIIATQQNGPYPPGAYATTISPLGAIARFDDQFELAHHLFSEGEKPVSWWVKLCAEANLAFRPTPDVPPERLDFWNASAPAGTPVPIAYAGTGPNPLPRGF